MNCDENYNYNSFITFDDVSEERLKNVKKTLAIFDYYSGINQLYAKYNYFYQTYLDITDILFSLRQYKNYFSDYIEELEYRRSESLYKLDAIGEKIYKLNCIQDEIKEGKQLIIIKR